MTSRPDRKDGEKKMRANRGPKKCPREKNDKRGRHKIRIKGWRKESVSINTKHLKLTPCSITSTPNVVLLYFQIKGRTRVGFSL